MNTVAVNGVYGEGKDVVEGALMGGSASGGGQYISKFLTYNLSEKLPVRIGFESFNPELPALLQYMGKPNPAPEVIGSGVSNAISYAPSWWWFNAEKMMMVAHNGKIYCRRKFGAICTWCAL
ncbi:hypothetical protein [Microvirgula aerodenitrificans]|uniref:hypothetical protein n=1 Tax=Microvirgula aerodenitrificans TaxID=57480 RepID=UPI0028EBC790|nr:hypothetical protein [Microvirgula aerodenitrificans]